MPRDEVRDFQWRHPYSEACTLRKRGKKMYMIRVSSLLIACAAFANAQDKVTVPLSNPSQPATVKVHLMNGSITVTGGGGSQVVVESGTDSRERRPPRDVPPGMHRVGGGSTGMDVEEDHNVVNIEAGRNGGGGRPFNPGAMKSALEVQTVGGGHREGTGVRRGKC